MLKDGFRVDGCLALFDTPVDDHWEQDEVAKLFCEKGSDVAIELCSRVEVSNEDPNKHQSWV